MMYTHPGRPGDGEYVPFYATYIRLVPDGDLLAILDQQIDETVVFLSTFMAEQAAWRPAPGEWNVKEIVGHLADAERVFAYRALCFARNDPTPLPGMNPDGFMVGACFADRSLPDVVEEFVAVRRASVALLGSLDAAAWMRSGVADGNPISVRALAYTIAGHALHHDKDFPNHRAMGEGV
ncbi:MAG: DinB family protein [Chloroflexota bacterium]|nr:DinB family protein [Chloroflexota bacterium]